jgi:hypothetical protein
MSASFVQFSINFNGDFVELLADKKDERKLNFIIKKIKKHQMKEISFYQLHFALS